jgi:arylsulfatase A-like enzyme
MHAWFDLELGRLIDELARLGELESTVILCVADNGWSPWRSSKGTPREKGVCVPLVVLAPAASARGMDGRLVDLVDVHATVLDYAGLAPDAASPGRSLRPVLEGRPDEPRARLFGSASTRRGSVYALFARDPRWKYVRYVRDARSQELSPPPWLAPDFRRRLGAEELFDLAADPGERTNLAKDAEHAERLAELRAATLEWWRASGGEALPESR